MSDQAQQMDRPYLDFTPAKSLPLAPAAAAPLAPNLPPIPLRHVGVGVILDCCAQAYLIDRADLTGTGKHKSVTEARRVAYWLLRTLGALSLPEIGRALAKDHTSAMVGVRACLRQREAEPEFEAFTDQLAAAIQARLGGVLT